MNNLSWFNRVGSIQVPEECGTGYDGIRRGTMIAGYFGKCRGYKVYP